MNGLQNLMLQKEVKIISWRSWEWLNIFFANYLDQHLLKVPGTLYWIPL